MQRAAGSSGGRHWLRWAGISLVVTQATAGVSGCALFNDVMATVPGGSAASAVAREAARESDDRARREANERAVREANERAAGEANERAARPASDRAATGPAPVSRQPESKAGAESVRSSSSSPASGSPPASQDKKKPTAAPPPTRPADFF